MRHRNTLLTLTVTLGLVAGAPAALVVWGGADGEYTTPGNWVGGNLPNTAAGDTAQINAGDVIYTPGGDLALNNGGTLQLTGGSWTQVDGVAWIQMAGGVLDVAGGTFNQGTCGNIVRDATSVIQVSAGTANFNGNLLYEPTANGALNITGGVVNVAVEFKPIDDFTMSAGTLSASLISFADGDGSILFSGGTIAVDGAGAYSGFYGGGDKSVNFSTSSTGTVRFENYTAAELTEDGFLTNGTIQVNGTIDASAFSVTESAGGVNVALVPEPVTASLLAVGALALLRRRR